ncbi:hypothetical protein LIP36_09735 [Amedibacillus dolichus]|uniref:phage baseplate protein n=1 Tax=Amedibacillus dolichus TaxID=31971 RepID=UPI001D018118|nr:hypothetical protein [Amedibacillus dolichus]MCB5373881.1 hypothetical protein [Amedibacillus dolichus]
MITITRKGLQLAINNEVIPAQGSSDVPIQFINDDETYRNYLIEPRVGWYKNGFPKSTVARYEEGIIYLPVEVFIKNGPIAIVIALIDPQNSNHIEVTHSVISAIANAPLGDIILPEKETWEQAVASLVKQLNEQIQADVAEAIKKANKASEDATAALTKSNQTNQTINDKIEDGSFVPQATAGTVEMTQPGTKAEVTITGDKKTPEFNFKIPKDEIDDSEDIKKALLQGTYITDFAEEYKGVASDYGAEILKIEGKSEQATTNGYQLFDASKLPTKTQGGATVTNNGDGSFTISGSGNLTQNFSLSYTLETPSEVKKLFKVGDLNLVNGNANGVPYFEIAILANGKTNYLRNGTIQITDEMMNASDLRLDVVVYGKSGLAIKGSTIKPMLYQEGDGTWEPFTGGIPSPNPNYPQEINNALDEPLVSVSRNLFNDEKGYNYSTNWKYVASRDYILKAFKAIKPKTKYTIFLYGISFIEKFASATLKNTNSKNENAKAGFFNGTNKAVIETKDFPHPMNENVLYMYATLTESEQAELKNLKVMIVEGDYSSDDLPYEPHKYAETPLNLSEPLRSLPDGTCDVYEKGTITRMIDYKEYDGSSDEAWKLQSINSNGIANFNIGISSSNQVAGSMCNRFIFDKSSISVATKEAYHLNDNNFFIRLKKETASTVEEFKVWLNEHPVRLLYQRPTPITKKVELPIVPTFYPYTNIFQSDNVKARIQYGLRNKSDECPYDIGDLYITLNETLPSVKWKGTKWERVEGFVPVGYKASDADFGTLGKTGGVKTVTLTEEQMPDHNHSAKAKKAANHKHGIALKTATGSATPHTGPGVKEGSWSSTDTHAWLDKSLCEEAGEHDHIITVENAGGSQAHNNLQPYKVFNMWVRTA